MDAARHRAALSASIQTMKRPTPTRDELPSGLCPRTLKTEPSRKMAAGGRPIPEKTLRMLNEVPAIAVALIVVLAVVKPF